MDSQCATGKFQCLHIPACTRLILTSKTVFGGTKMHITTLERCLYSKFFTTKCNQSKEISILREQVFLSFFFFLLLSKPVDSFFFLPPKIWTIAQRKLIRQKLIRSKLIRCTKLVYSVGTVNVC